MIVPNPPLEFPQDLPIPTVILGIGLIPLFAIWFMKNTMNFMPIWLLVIFTIESIFFSEIAWSCIVEMYENKKTKRRLKHKWKNKKE